MKLKLTLTLTLAMILTVLIVNIPVRGTRNTFTETAIYYDIAIDDERQLVYATERESDLLHVISSETLQITKSLAIGDEPCGIDISPDGNELAVALFSDEKIVFVDLNTLEILSDTVTLDVSSWRNQPEDLVYGRPGRLYAITNTTYAGADGVHVINTETKTEVGKSPDLIVLLPRLVITPDNNTIYAAQATNRIFRLDISTDNPVVTGETSDAMVDKICYRSDGTIFTSSGELWSGDLTTRLQLYYLDDYNVDQLECSNLHNRMFLSGTTDLEDLDWATLTRYKMFLPPAVTETGIARLDANEEYLYVSTNDGIHKVRSGYDRAYNFLPINAYALCPTEYVEDFNNDYHYWPVGEDDYVRAGTLDGEYSIFTKSDQYIFAFASPSCERYYYTVDIDARWEGWSGYSYGLVFGVKDNWDYYYLFDLSASYQAFRLYYRTPDGFKEITAPTVSSVINTGNATNHLEVRYYGRKILLYINGTEVANEWWSGDDILGLSRVGVVTMATGSYPSVDARFDNIRIMTLNELGIPEANPQISHDEAIIQAETWPLPTDIDWPLPPLNLFETQD